VELFNVVTPWYDKEQADQKPVGAVVSALQKANSGGRHAEAIEPLQTLQAHFQNAGRDKYGMNRTAPGEPVTPDNVYLGNVFGRWTLTATKWKDAFKRGDATAQEDKRIIDHQAADFVDGHVGAMHKLIRALATSPRK
jgi:hypothetical protein